MKYFRAPARRYMCPLRKDMPSALKPPASVPRSGCPGCGCFSRAGRGPQIYRVRSDRYSHHQPLRASHRQTVDLPRTAAALSSSCTRYRLGPRCTTSSTTESDSDKDTTLLRAISLNGSLVYMTDHPFQFLIEQVYVTGYFISPESGS